MATDMYEHYETLKGDGVILYFNGPVSQGVVEGIAELMRDRMRSEEAGAKLSQRIFAILVEQMQNIVRYSVEQKYEDGSMLSANGQVVVGREVDGNYFVACGNKVNTADVNSLRRKLETIRGMNKDDLKAYYREKRRSGPDPDSRGAGLGFIEMARKAQKPLDFSIRSIDDDTSFFSMKVVA